MYKLIFGTVKEVHGRHLLITVPNENKPIKTIRCNPLGLDEREQKPNIKIGTECLTFYDEVRGVGFTAFSISQAIELSDKISRIENDLILLYGKDIRLMDCTGDNKDTVEKISDSLTTHCKKYEIKSESDELITTLIDLVSEIISIKVVNMAIHKVSPLEPLDGGTIAKLSSIKTRLHSFK
jgi:hypothetical protein